MLISTDETRPGRLIWWLLEEIAKPQSGIRFCRKPRWISAAGTEVGSSGFDT